jgi:LysR family transcriptional regulator, regulator for bpeEF and oprC
LPLDILEEHLAAHRLTRILVDYATDGVPINLLYPQNRMLSSKVTAFASWSQDLFASPKHVSAAT